MSFGQKLRKIKSCSSLSDDQFAHALSNQTLPRAKREDPVRIGWRCLMGLQLPIDENLWETDQMGFSTITAKPGELNNYKVYKATVSFSKSGTDVKPQKPKQRQAVPKSALKKAPLDKSQSEPQLPKVDTTNPPPPEDDKPPPVFEPNSKVNVAASRLTNRDLEKHNSLIERMRRCLFCKKVAHPLEADFSDNPPRTTNSVSYITTTFAALAAKPVPQGRSEAYATLIEAYRLTLEAIRHMNKVKDLCENAKDTLSYSNYYLERRLNEEELKMTENKSIIGSLAWISTYCVQFLPPDKDKKNVVKTDVKYRLEDVVGSSILLWSAMVHTVETLRACTSILEHAVPESIFTMKAPEEEQRRNSEAPLEEINSDKIDRLKRKRWRIHHKAAMKQAIQDMYYWDGKTRPVAPSLIIFARARAKETPGEWQNLQEGGFTDALSLINQCSSKILTIVEDELTQLSRLDKAVQTQIGHLDRAKRSKSFFESVLVLEQVLRSLHEFPNNLLKQREVDDFKEVGRIILDRLDELERTVEAMEAIAMEASHIVHICYEYTRVFYRWPIKDYDTFGPDNHKRYLELWAHNSKFLVAKPPESLKDTILLFNDSIYQRILKTVILNVGERHLCLAPSDAKQPTDAIVAIETSKLVPIRPQLTAPEPDIVLPDVAKIRAAVETQAMENEKNSKASVKK